MFVSRKHLRPTTSFYFPLETYFNFTTAATPSSSPTQCTQRKHTHFDDSIKNNPFYAKYESKINQLKQADGIQQQTQVQKGNHSSVEKQSPLNRKFNISGSTLPANLNELIKTELLLQKSTEQISEIWTEYWASKHSICAIISKDVFNTMVAKITECPMFLYPLPREQSYDFYLSQFKEYYCFYTALKNFQVYGDQAPCQLCFKFYTELSESKGIVLMASEFDNVTISLVEVQYLAQLQQLFYANPIEERYDLLRQFNHDPESFKYMDVVKQIESGDFAMKKK